MISIKFCLTVGFSFINYIILEQLCLNSKLKKNYIWKLTNYIQEKVLIIYHYKLAEKIILTSCPIISKIVLILFYYFFV